jgi:dipeptidyl aminopeptidase/acylaminoacyl peptidase
MRAASVFLSLVALAAPLGLRGAAAQRTAHPSAHSALFSLDDYSKIARVNGLRVSPDGDRAVIVVGWPDYVTDRWVSNLVVIDLRTKAQRTITVTGTAGAPRWSPTGDRIAYTAKGSDENTQLFVIPADGGTPTQVTHEPNGISGFSWTPDGSGFAVTATRKEAPRNKYDDSFLVTANDYLARSASPETEIHLIGADGSGKRTVSIDHGSVSGGQLVWYPNGRTLIYGIQAGPGTRLYPKRSVAIVDVTTGTSSTIAALDRRWCGSLTPSPDGKHLLASCFADGKVQNQSELLVIPADGQSARKLTTLDRNLSRGVWSADSRYVVATAPDSVTSGLWEIPLDGAPRRRAVGMMEISEVDVARDGTIVFVGTTPMRPAEVYIYRPAAKSPERLTDLQAPIAALDLGKSETIVWKNDGFTVSGVLTYPPHFDPSRRYPVLLDIHGGPWGSSREGFSAQVQLFAAQGWIVFEPNYRGSDNMGAAFYSAVYRDHGAGPGRDVMAGLALVKQRPYIDTTRIGVSGWSYGGYMTTWLIGHYQGWKAAMAGAAVIDLVDDYNLNDLSLYMRAFSETLSFADDLALMKEQSPLTYVDSMRTPLLLLSDAADARVPVTQSYKLYHALKERGRDVQMRLWPVAGHFPTDPYRVRDIDQKWMEFFRERFK